MSYETILLEVKSRIELHKKFKDAYNKQLAFDFNLFNFFKIGENKISELLAFFINPMSSHGQQNAFIKEFLRILAFDVKDEAISEITCEKGIDNQRRIDLYIKFI
ncbi:MAG: PD-(D/E)XK nuclease family protein [Bacteroidales bacterium]|nr:PD-(D/E)XK nuclease family protein [Bacteroidales bacterium]